VAHKIRYDGEADVLTIVLMEKGELSHIEETADAVVV
jgi:uncharacterized protein YuzE